MQSKNTLTEVLLQTTTQKYSFFAAGNPACQGSKTAFGRVGKDKNTGKTRAFVNMVEQDKGLDEWRLRVGNVAKVMLPADWQTEGLFALRVIFYLPRPKAHYSTSGELKPSAPVFHSQKKDYDKLLRAIGDSLTGICYQDDCMVVHGGAMKFYEPTRGRTGAWISVSRLDEVEASRLARELLQ